MKKFLENIVFRRQKEVLVLGIFLLNRSEWRFSFVRARVYKNEITIVSTAEDLKDIEREKSAGDVPVILHLDGWGVLIKENLTGNNAVPTDNHDFYTKEYQKADGSGSYFAIVRKELLNSIMEFCTSALLNVTDLDFGPFSTTLLSPYLPENKEIRAGKWKLSLNKVIIASLVAEVTDNQSIYEIGGDKITSGLLPLYASAVKFFAGERGNEEILSVSREKLVYEKLTKYLAVSSLTVLLVLLLGNYLIWDFLRKKNSEVTSEVSRNEQLLHQLTEKEKELREKENLVVQYVGTSARTRYSLYADKLASTLPAGIRLTLMDMQPLKKRQKPGIAIEYKSNQIDIEGETKNMSEISDWIKVIEMEKWTRKVELVSFSAEKDKAVGHFKLVILY